MRQLRLSERHSNTPPSDWAKVTCHDNHSSQSNVIMAAYGKRTVVSSVLVSTAVTPTTRRDLIHRSDSPAPLAARGLVVEELAPTGERNGPTVHSLVLVLVLVLVLLLVLFLLLLLVLLLVFVLLLVLMLMLLLVLLLVLLLLFLLVLVLVLVHARCKRVVTSVRTRVRAPVA
ncbi:hypothetical protein LSAT2_001970 [Lamellibrachia satsuma]|nr:hypothetical protein LSAT2_001970 [Lamellibrachia satsuma]